MTMQCTLRRDRRWGPAVSDVDTRTWTLHGVPPGAGVSTGGPAMVALSVSVSAHGSSGMIAVGLIEPGALLPCDVRVVDFEVAELVADGITQRLGNAATCG